MPPPTVWYRRAHVHRLRHSARLFLMFTTTFGYFVQHLRARNREAVHQRLHFDPRILVPTREYYFYVTSRMYRTSMFGKPTAREIPPLPQLITITTTSSTHNNHTHVFWEPRPDTALSSPLQAPPSAATKGHSRLRSSQPSAELELLVGGEQAGIALVAP